MAIRLEFTNLPELTEVYLYADRHRDDPVMDKLARKIERKIDRMVERDLYARSKSASTAAEREEARQRYLESKGVPPSFRW